MSPNDDKPKVERFDGSNYNLWSYKMKMYLMSKGLWETVAGTALEVNESKMQQAHAAIVLNIADSQIMHIINAQNAQEAWSGLEAFHRSKNMANRMWLKEKFAAFKFTANGMSKHICELESLVMEMNSADCQPSEEDICATLLRSLPPSYESLVQAFRMSMNVVSWSDVVNRLTSEEIRQKDSCKIEEQTAMLSDRSRPKKAFKKKKDKKSVTCFNCGKQGHYKNECRSTRHDMEESNVAFHAHDTSVHVDSRWIIDSGASNHMCMQRDSFVTYETEMSSKSVSTAKTGNKLKVLGVGTVAVVISLGNKLVKIRLENTLHVEDLSKNLFSVPAILKKGMKIEMGQTGCMIKHQGKTVATGSQRGSLIYLDTQESSQCQVAQVSADTWHRRLGHASMKSIQDMMVTGAIKGGTQPGKVTESCEVCAMAKQVKKSFLKTSTDEAMLKDNARANDIICSDVLGPITPSSNSGYRYVVSFIMMKCRYITIYPMRKKDEVLVKFMKFCNDIKTLANICVKTIRSDNGGEYRSTAMREFCQQKNIIQEFTIPHTPEQNGMCERANRTLVEMTRCMLKDGQMEREFWVEAMMTATKIRNIISHAVHPETTPFEMLFKRKPNLEHMKIFGCECYAHVPKANRRKLDDTGVKCRFLGYSNDQKGYRLLSIESGKIINSRSVTFVEKKCQSKSQKEQSIVDIIDTQVDDAHKEHTQEPESTEQRSQEDASMENENESSIPEAPRTPIRVHQKSKATKLSETPGRDNEDESKVRPVRKKQVIQRYQDEYPGLFCLTATEDEDISSFDQAMLSQHKEQWLKAMKSEMNSIISHQTWNLEELPKGKKTIGCRWLFKIKRNPDGSVNKFKARLCAKGYTQKYGIDYNETFAPVARMTSIRTMMSIAAEKDLEVQQFDVDTAFLNSDIDEEIYMDQPEGFVDKNNPKLVCKLNKSLYGTKQAARQWNAKLDQHLSKQGFNSISADACVYVRILEEEYSILAIYVDDLIIMSNAIQNINKIKEEMKRDFKIKELGDIKYCLGIEIHRDRALKKIVMNQKGYILKTAEKFGVLECKDIHTPADCNAKLMKMPDDEEFTERFPYRQLVGSLMYAMTGTRPDIANALGNVSKYCEKYNKSHWVAAKRILKYLKTTKNYGIVLNGMKQSELHGYADANWAADLDTRRSTTGYLFMLNNSLISWKSQRQATVATSSTESEYMSLYSAVQEMVWLRRLLTELSYFKSGPTTIYQDNQGCIALSKNPVFHSRTKHIDIKFHFLREKIKSGELDVPYLPTEQMLADALTKDLPRPKFEIFVEATNMKHL